MADTIKTASNSTTLGELASDVVIAYVKDGMGGAEFDVEAFTNRGRFTVHFEISVRRADESRAVN